MSCHLFDLSLFNMLNLWFDQLMFIPRLDQFRSIIFSKWMFNDLWLCLLNFNVYLTAVGLWIILYPFVFMDFNINKAICFNISFLFFFGLHISQDRYALNNFSIAAFIVFNHLLEIHLIDHSLQDLKGIHLLFQIIIHHDSAQLFLEVLLHLLHENFDLFLWFDLLHGKLDLIKPKLMIHLFFQGLYRAVISCIVILTGFQGSLVDRLIYLNLLEDLLNLFPSYFGVFRGRFLLVISKLFHALFHQILIVLALITPSLRVASFVPLLIGLLLFLRFFLNIFWLGWFISFN